ncbi:MAG: hypothetical protein Kow00105_19240 [Phycisphaeraceae bacterium]
MFRTLRCVKLSPALFGLIVVLMGTTHALAIPPIILHQFTFDPEASRLGVTGGFAGIDEVHGIEGTFGIAIGYDQVYDPVTSPPTISLVPFVSFAAVEARLTKPGLLEGADLDSLLNLTGLDGSFVFGPDFRGLLFTGVDGQGQPMKVRVTVKRRQLHLEGENTPGCCDLFHYRLNAFADFPSIGDINKDGFVGIDDLNAVLSNFGHDVTPMLGPDANWDGYVGIDDLNAVLGDWNVASPSIPTVVPEPTVVTVLIASGAALLIRRRQIAF